MYVSEDLLPRNENKTTIIVYIDVAWKILRHLCSCCWLYANGPFLKLKSGSYFWGVRREVCKMVFMIWRENDTAVKGKKILPMSLKNFFIIFEIKTWSGWCLFIQLIASDQFNKINVQLEVVIQPCALLTANGGFEMGTSKLDKLYLEVNCYTSLFCIGNSQFKSNHGFTMVILVVQTNYWDTELWLSEEGDLGVPFL